MAPAAAQTAPGDPAAQTGQISAAQKAELQRLVATLKDDAKRKELIATLEQLIALQSPKPDAPRPSGLLERVVAQIGAIGAGIQNLAEAVPNLPEAWDWIRLRAEDKQFRAELLAGLWKGLLVLFAGIAVAWLARRALHKPRARLSDRASDRKLARLGYLALRALLDLVPVAAFAAVGLIVLPLTQPSPTTSAIVLALITAVVVVRAVLVLARAVFAPDAQALRMIPLGDEQAAYLYVWVKRLTEVIVYGYCALVALDALYLPGPAYQAALKVLGVVVTALVVVLILQNKSAVADWLARRDERRDGRRDGRRAESGDESRGEVRGRSRWHGIGRRVGGVWHVLAILYVVGAFLVWSLDVAGGFAFLVRATILTILVVAVARLVIVGLRLLLDRIFSVDRDFAARHPGLRDRATRYLPAVRAITTGAVWIAAVAALLQVWGVDIVAVLATDGGKVVLSTSASIGVVVIGAIIVWALIKSAIARYIQRLSERTRDGERVARVRTLLPMLEKAIFFALILITALIIMAELGIDIGPMIAGAGVIGLAIGFGAQTLVKDIITGVFTVMEDSMAVGDLVTVAGRTGTVTDLSIRSVILRDYYGTQHTIPFSAISDVQNLSKDFSYAVIDVGVSYRENVDEVIAIIERVAADYRADPEASAAVVEDLEVAGVHELADSAVVLRTRFKCRPGTQFAVRREMNKRIKAAFDEAGVEIPYPHQTLYFGEDRKGRAAPARLRFDRSRERPGDDRVPADEPELPLAAE